MRKLWLTAIALGTVLAGCVTPAPAQPAPQLAGTSWRVSRLNGVPTLPDAQPSLAFTADQVGGTASCNRFGAGYTLTGASLKIGPAVMTQMACEPAVMAQEQRFAAALNQVAAVRTANAEVELVDAGGNLVMTLVPMVNRPLAGTDWQLSGIIANEAISSLIAGSSVSLRITDGQLSGKACNLFNGPVRVSGDNFDAGPLASTRMACADPAIGQQEHSVLRILEAVTTFRIEENSLRLTAPDGTGLLFTAA